jgi:hypothetical protein
MGLKNKLEVPLLPPSANYLLKDLVMCGRKSSEDKILRLFLMNMKGLI